jgi:DNA-binding PadR family transcriptional regulator
LTRLPVAGTPRSVPRWVEPEPDLVLLGDHVLDREHDVGKRLEVFEQERLVVLQGECSADLSRKTGEPAVRREAGPDGVEVFGFVARFLESPDYVLVVPEGHGRILALTRSIGWFWPIPHAQLYRYPARLAERGLLTEQVEDFGRRRRVFHLTDAGRAALSTWLADTETADLETRDPAAVKLALADLVVPEPVAELAREQARRHRSLLAVYQQRRAEFDPDAADARSRARMMAFGIAISRAYVDYWQSLTESPDES